MSYADTIAPLLDDIRAPLALVLGPLERLEIDANPQQLAVIELLRHNASQALSDLDDLGQLTQFHRGNRAPAPRPFDCAPLIRGLVAALRRCLEEKDLKLDFRDESASMPVFADSADVEKGLISLLLTVIQRTPTGGRIQLRTSQTQVTLRHTYEAEFQGGIGIALAEALIGPLEICRENEVTSRILCHLPPADEAEPPPLSLSETWRDRLSPALTLLRPTLPEPSPSSPKPSLLIVDDETDLLDFFAATLAEDYQVYRATDGGSGLALALRHTPDLVLTDQNMPGGDGVTLCRQLRSHPEFETTRILLMTGRTRDAIRLEALEAGANDFLSKPFSIVELRTRLNSMLRSSQLERELAARNRELLEAQSQLIARERLSALGSLSAGLMHEINNPIHYMVTGLAILETCCDDHETLADIRDGLRRVQEIIGAVRNFAYQGDTSKTACQPNELFATVRRLLATDLSEVELAESADDQAVRANENQLVQVLVNLLQNAMHATRNNPDDRPARIAISAKKGVISVQDNGAGIPKEIMPRIFDPFFTSKKQGEGTGLGLSIAYNIIQKSGGELRVRSEPGDTCFSLHLAKQANHSA
jgi:signal transduction histidine kinase